MKLGQIMEHGRFITLTAGARRLGWTNLRLLHYVEEHRLSIKRDDRGHTFVRIADVQQIHDAQRDA
jgi:hypothetical protein